MKPEPVARFWHMILIYVIAWYGPALVWMVRVPRERSYLLAVLGGWIYDGAAGVARGNPSSLPYALLLAGALTAFAFPLGTAAVEWGVVRKVGYKANLRGICIILLVVLSFLWHGVALMFVSV